MRRILVVADYFLPGVKAGGPLRTLKNLVDHLSSEFVFSFVTRDRDLGDEVPYQGLQVNQWLNRVNYRVFYLGGVGFKDIHIAVSQIDYDVIYLNSYFSVLTMKILVLQKLGFLRNVPVIICPRGEFSSGALSLSSRKKLAFISIAKTIGLYSKVRWQATTLYEEADIRRIYGDGALVRIAADLPPVIDEISLDRRRPKQKGYLRLLFLSRICEIKNLRDVLLILRDVSGNVEFNIYGPIEDELYWSNCEDIINELPSSVKAKYCGVVANDHVYETMLEHDLFILPTLGENFGHAILEALVCGCPVLISDNTPWRHLRECGVGWDVPLDRLDMFKEIIERCISMEQGEFIKISSRAQKMGAGYTSDKSIVQKSRRLFQI